MQQVAQEEKVQINSLTVWTFTNAGDGMGRIRSYAASNYNRAFAVGVALNLCYIVVAAILGIMADSLAWLANVGDPRLRLFNQIAKEAKNLGVRPI